MTLISSPDNEAPDGAVSGFITTEDGVRLRYARWPARGERTRGTICLFQGRAEFIEKYFETIGELQARGFAVATLDWRGQGMSDRLLRHPRKGHVDDFRSYARDLDAFIKQVALPDTPQPHFGLGHSMGGCILFHAVLRDPRLFDRVVTTAPMLELGDLGMPHRFARGLASFLTYLGLGEMFVPFGSARAVNMEPFAGNKLTADPQRYQRNARIIEKAPDLALAAPTVSWIRAAFRAMDLFKDPAFGDRLKVPSLIMAAGNDKVVATAALERVALQMRMGTCLVLPAARHEVLMERDQVRDPFWAAFDAFIPGSTDSMEYQDSVL